MAQANLSVVECPVCSRSFKSWMINGHVEQCLSSSSEKHDNQKKAAATGHFKDDGIGKTPIIFNRSPMNLSKTLEASSQSSSNKRSTIASPPLKKARVENTDSQDSKRSRFAPLAERLRPTSLDEFVGQTQVVGDNCVLKKLLDSDEIPSIIFWGPPGCGKTTLANIIANNAKKGNTTRFVKLSATMSGVASVKDIINVAKNDQTMFQRKTILFVDEIHRFNKLQQDTFLPHVENGTITLIGATTENPSFHVNAALLSRCRVIVLQKLTANDIVKILQSGILSLGGLVHEDMEAFLAEDSKRKITIKKESLLMLANFCDGDARSALNGLETTFKSKLSSLEDDASSNTRTEHQSYCITAEDIRESLQRSHICYDRNGEEHYNIISALHKSVRGGDENAALYWLGRMLVGGEDPLYIARRLVRMASEDIGLADPLALNQAVSAFQACHFIGKPECDVILAQVTVYLARAPKSVEVYKAYAKVVEHIKSYQGTLPGVPLHLRNAPTKLMKELGYGKGYKYNPDYDTPVDQEYLPPELKGLDFFTKP